jgi:hypothetical protein
MHISGLRLKNILHNNIAVNGERQQFDTQRGDADVENGWYSTMDGSGAISLIQALVTAKMANTSLRHTDSHPNFGNNIL